MTIVSEIDCSISAVIVRKDFIKSDGFEIDIFAMEMIFERLCYFLNVANGNNRLYGNDEEYAIIMIDSVDKKYDNKIRMKIRSLFDNGTRYEKNKYLIEDPIFVDSSYRHMS